MTPDSAAMTGPSRRAPRAAAGAELRRGRSAPHERRIETLRYLRSPYRCPPKPLGLFSIDTPTAVTHARRARPAHRGH